MKQRLLKLIDAMTPQEIYKAMYTDHLTGAGNRAAFDDAVLNPNVTHIAIADLDSLKYVNDVAGHRTGDKMLKSLVATLSATFGPDNVYRLGGDEFAVVNANTCGWEYVLHLGAIQNAFSFGVGPTLDTADKALELDKKAGTLTGRRAGRGLRPEWFDRLIGAECES